VVEVYAGDKLVRRFIRVDKLSTALGTSDSEARPTATATACSMKT
jgi:hypothetical protein